MDARLPTLPCQTWAIFVEAPNRAKAAVMMRDQIGGGSILEIAELLNEFGPAVLEDDDYARNEWESD